METRQDMLRVSVLPRGLTRAQAAAYVGVGATLFDQLVAARLMPAAKRVRRRRIWDRLALDRAFAALPNEDGSGPAQLSEGLGTEPEFVL